MKLAVYLLFSIFQTHAYSETYSPDFNSAPDLSTFYERAEDASSCLPFPAFNSAGIEMANPSKLWGGGETSRD